MSLSIPSNRRKGKPEIENAGARSQETGDRMQNAECRRDSTSPIIKDSGLRTQDAEVG
jgi:hypothetical protein